MNSRQLKALVRSMNELGVTHLKTKDIDITLQGATSVQPAKVEPIAPERVILPQADPADPLAAMDEKEIKIRVDNVKSIMTTGDEDLIDLLFPVKRADDISDFPEID